MCHHAGEVVVVARMWMALSMVSRIGLPPRHTDPKLGLCGCGVCGSCGAGDREGLGQRSVDLDPGRRIGHVHNCVVLG